MTTPPETTPPEDDFEKSAEQKQTGVFREVWDLLRHNKKWWLLPILLVLAVVGVLLVLGATGAAPFIYTLF
jgi:drug/metabolite transporter superfamily protein YnfA